MDHDIWVSLNGGIDPERYNSMSDSCPQCHVHFLVTWNEARGFCEREEYYCPQCRAECGSVPASNIPKTEAFPS